MKTIMTDSVICMFFEKNNRFRRGLCLLALLAGMGGCTKSPGPGAAPDAKDNTLAPSEPWRKFIAIEAIADGKGGLSGVLPGRVAFYPQAMAAIGSPVTARIVSVEARPGTTVNAGTPLLTLQSAEAAAVRASLEQAAARAAAAEDLLRRQNEMIKKGVGLEVERFAAETAAREARTELARARRAAELIGAGDGDRFVLRAPAKGVVLTVRANVGAVVAPGGDPLVEIGDPDKLWIVADVPESEIGGIAIGRSAEIDIPGADRRLAARVEGIGQVLDGEQRRLPIYLALREPAKLTPGMLVEVRLSTVDEPVMTLPTSAVLIKDGDRRIVYVQRSDGRLEARAVRTGVSRDGRVAILQGLRPEDKVVVRGSLLIDSEAEQLL